MRCAVRRLSLDAEIRPSELWIVLGSHMCARGSRRRGVGEEEAQSGSTDDLHKRAAIDVSNFDKIRLEG